MIRPAVAADKAALIGLARRFHAAAPLLAAHPFSALAAARTAHAHIGQPGALLLVLDLSGIKGALVAHLQPLPFSDALVAHEVAFWIDHEARGRWGVMMIRAYEAWAKAKGAALVGLVSLDGRAGSMFQRMGFAPVETMMVKEI